MVMIAQHCKYTKVIMSCVNYVSIGNRTEARESLEGSRAEAATSVAWPHLWV